MTYERRYAGIGMERRGQRGANDASGAATYQSILGALLAEMWHSQLGIATASGNVDTWTGQIQGRVAQAPAGANRPVYASDASNFTTGISVPQFDGVANYLQYIGGPSVTNSVTPNFIVVYRVRSVIGAGTPGVFTMTDSTPTQVCPQFYINSSDRQNTAFTVAPTVTNVALVGVSPHIAVGGLRSSDNFAYAELDGVRVVAASGGTTVVTTRMFFGSNQGASFCPVNIALALVLTGEPSGAQIAAVSAKARAEFGF